MNPRNLNKSSNVIKEDTKPAKLTDSSNLNSSLLVYLEIPLTLKNFGLNDPDLVELVKIEIREMLYHYLLQGHNITASNCLSVTTSTCLKFIIAC